MIFDGTCAFCDGSVRFIARRDPSGYFRFGASQSPGAAQLLREHNLTQVAAHSLILIEHGCASVRSTAALRIARRLTLPWRLFAVLLLVPRPIRDGVYAVVAAFRHQILRRDNSCALPPAEVRSRLI